jgi:hypothetical protein
MKKLFAPALALSLPLLAAEPIPAEASEKLPNGRWHITLRGSGPHILCYGQITRVGEVRSGRPVYNGQARYRFHLSKNGHITASGSRRDDHASLRGQIRNGRTGSGSFTIPTRNCSGTWQVTKIGD